jgi:ribonucleotide reductase alpha subunit
MDQSYMEMEKEMNVLQDFSRDSLFSDQALKLLQDYYMIQGETSPQQAFARAALAYSDGDVDLAQRIYDYASKGWFMFASPVLSNAPAPGKPWKSLPISCFLSYVPDSLEGLIDHTTETRWLSVKGGGVGGHWSDVRSVSDIAPGPIPFLKTVDADMTAYRQGKTRKGSYAAYLDIDHPDVEEFLVMRAPTGGDENRKCFNLHNAINVSDAFMEAVMKGEDWNLIDPNSREIRKTLPARDLWQRILETRSRTGEPYLNFIDTANRSLPETQKQLGLKIHGSNLCFPGDTLVYVVKGGLVSIEELANRGSSFWVWSASLQDGRWRAELDEAIARMTGVQPVVRVVLSSGHSFECTEDHRLAKPDGTYVKAMESAGCMIQGIYFMDDKIQTSDVSSQVVDISFTGKVVPVYDLQVKSNHNFFIATDPKYKGGILVHNCNEIHLATDETRTAVCCLSSINLEFYDEWKNTTIVQDLIRMLDNVLQCFIDHCPNSLYKARYSAIRERSLGLGMMGFHSLLQKRGLPFESALASSLNRKIFKMIKDRALEESRQLALERGEPEDMRGTGLRNAHLLAIAPNANSSIIVGCSPSIEPWKSNAYTHRTRAGTHLVKNVHLEEILERMGHNTPEVWQSIIMERGSVQQLDFLSREQKDVFKTAFELDQRWIVDHAATRQPFICQGQSVNLFFPSGSDRSYVNEVHLSAWKRGLKGLYYYRSSAERMAEGVSRTVSQGSLANVESSECMSCHA